MGRRGPKSRPTALKLLRGERSDRVNDAEPAPAAGGIEPPGTLAGLAREEWERLAPVLRDMGVLTDVDRAALRLYCEAHDLYRRAYVEIAEHGLLVGTGLGAKKKNPALDVLAQASATMIKLLAQFGGTPSARTGLKVEARERDELADFLAQRKG